MQSLRRVAAATGNLVTSPPTIRKRPVTARMHFPLNCKVECAPRCILLQPTCRFSMLCERVFANSHLFLFIDDYFKMACCRSYYYFCGALCSLQNAILSTMIYAQIDLSHVLGCILIAQMRGLFLAIKSRMIYSKQNVDCYFKRMHLCKCIFCSCY